MASELAKRKKAAKPSEFLLPKKELASGKPVSTACGRFGSAEAHNAREPINRATTSLRAERLPAISTQSPTVSISCRAVRMVNCGASDQPVERIARSGKANRNENLLSATMFALKFEM